MVQLHEFDMNSIDDFDGTMELCHLITLDHSSTTEKESGLWDFQKRILIQEHPHGLIDSLDPVKNHDRSLTYIEPTLRKT